MVNELSAVIKNTLAHWKLINAVAIAMMFSVYVGATDLMTFFNILGAALVVAPFEPNYRKRGIILMRLSIVILATYITNQI